MRIFKNRFFAILSAFLILMAVVGIGVVAAQEADDSSSTDTSSDDSSSDSSDDSSSDDSSSSEDSSTEEAPAESGDVTAEDDSNSADDGSTIVEVEETNTEETIVEVQDADDVITSEGPVEYEEVNTEISDNDVYVSDDDYTITDNDVDIDTYGPVIYNPSDDDYNYTSYDNDITTAGNNSTIVKDSTIITDITEIEHTEIKQVNLDNSETVSIDVKNDNSVVNNVYFVPTKDAGKAKVVVEDLKPGCIKEKPVGIVYKSFNIFIDNPEATVDNAAVDFKVEKTWLIENNLDSSTIILNMYEGGKWIEVPVTVTGGDSQFVYFKAKVSKYSTFAISSKAITVDKVLKQENMTVSEEEIDGPTKSVVIKMLEFVIELLEGK